MAGEEYPSHTAYVAATLKEQVVIKTPRCPKCNRIQANAIIFGDFTCPDCKTHFIIGSGFTSVLTDGKVVIR